MKTKSLLIIIISIGLFIFSSCRRIQTCTCTTTINGQIFHTSAATVKGNKKDRQTECDDVKVEHDQFVWSAYPNQPSVCEIK